MKIIDNLLDKITMYRLVFYYLIFLVVAGILLSALGFLSFSPFSLLISTAFFLVICYITNKIFAFAFDAPTNIESVYITSLILALIVRPANNLHDYPILFWMAVWAMASKYMFAINKKHLFNPAAFAVALTSFTIGGTANWWVGTLSMLPFVLVGLLIVRKIRRYDLVFYFFVFAIGTILGLSALKGSNPFDTLKKTFVDSPILFLAFIMLTEPLTTPPTKKLQSIYGALVGFLFSPQLQFAGFYTTPEIALLIGNIYSYVVSPKSKLILYLREKINIGQGIVDFVFPKPANFSFIPGQYMEWILPHTKTDDRGNRRYFTIASSPTEDHLRLGVRFYENPSSFKNALSALDAKTPFIATNVYGDFVLPKDKSKKLAFLAGGIGVTPFRSIIKYLVDKNEKRDIVLVYSNRNAKDVVYTDVFGEAEKKIGAKIVYLLTDSASKPANWTSPVGRLDSAMLINMMPDFKDRTFYISGSQGMVDGAKDVLRELKVPNKQVVTDYFPGLA